MVGRPNLAEQSPDGRKGRYRSKLEILLFLMTGEKQESQIRDYLEKTCDLNDRGNVKEQLGQLRQEGYIKSRREPIFQGPKTPNYHSLSDECDKYDGIKKLFGYISSHGNEVNVKYNVQTDWPLEFLQTSYAQTMINEKILVNIERDLTELIHPIERICFYIESGMTVDQIKTEIPTWEVDAQQKEMSQSILNEIESNPPILNLIQKGVKNYRYGELRGKFAPSYTNPKVKKIIDAINKTLSNWGIELFAIRTDTQFGGTTYSPKCRILHNERTDLLRILKTSPSAMSFVLNLTEPTAKKSTLVLIPYTQHTRTIINTVAKALERVDLLKSTPTECSDLVKNALTENPPPTSPLFLILKSCLIFDAFEDRIVKSDWFWEFYSSMFKTQKEASL